MLKWMVGCGANNGNVRDNDDEDRYGLRREVEFEFLFAIKLYNVSMC